MRQTNSAPTLGMHHSSFNQGLSSFFLRRSNSHIQAA
jgi:hypothetical protein